jgi:hypothetical protein
VSLPACALLIHFQDWLQHCNEQGLEIRITGEGPNKTFPYKGRGYNLVAGGMKFIANEEDLINVQLGRDLLSRWKGNGWRVWLRDIFSSITGCF